MLATPPTLASQQNQEGSAGGNELQKLFAAARAAKEAGDLPAAASANQKLIALSLREMGKLRLFENAYPEAAELYRRSLELEDVPDAHADLAIAYLLANRPADSAVETRKALASDPRNAATWTVQGEALIKTKDYRGAVEALHRSLEIRPDPETSYALASCFLRLKEKEKAAAIFRQMIAVAGERSDLYLLFGFAYRDAGMADDAGQQYRRALALNPRAPNAHYHLGLSYLMGNEWAPTPEGRSEFLKELELNPRNFAAHYLLGYMAFSSNQEAEADHYLGIAAQLKPSSPETWLYLGLNAYRRKQNQRAEKLFRTAILLAEQDGIGAHNDIRKAYTSLGRILMGSGRTQEGKRYLQKARDLQQLMMADSQQGSGMAEPAGSGVSSADVPNLPQEEAHISLPGTGKADPTAPLNARVLSRANFTSEQKKLIAAQEQYLRSVLGASFNDLATAEAIQEQYAAALGHYQEAERWDPKVPNLMRNLGFAAYRAGNHPEAIRALKKALVISPGDDAARAVLNELRTSNDGAASQNKKDKQP